MVPDSASVVLGASHVYRRVNYCKTLPRWVEIGLELETRYYKHRLPVTSRSDQVRPLRSDQEGSSLN
jgi:hypothetical protein